VKKFAALTLLLAAPLTAQNGEPYYAPAVWPVHASGTACTIIQVSGGDDAALSIELQGREVLLTSTSSVESELPETGKVELALVFLDNGRVRRDDGWGTREFTYARAGDLYRFSTRFAGDRNMRQILSDLAASRSLGILQGEQVIFSFDLADIAPSIARLEECSGRARN